MATFRVGQRVRVWRRDDRRIKGCSTDVWAGPRAEGKTGVVCGTNSQPNAGFVHGPDLYSVKLDGCSLVGMVRGVNLEPIQPERNQVIPWSECLWQPNRTEEHA